MDTGAPAGRQAYALRQEICRARARISVIVVQRDDLQLRRIPKVRADYAQTIGCWELALCEAELAACRARRRFELVSTQLSAQEAAQLSDGAIEATLDEEFAVQSEEVEQKRVFQKQALGYLAERNSLTFIEIGMLRRHYHRVSLRVHPDVCHRDDPERARLFAAAQAAFHRDDLAALRTLEQTTRPLDTGNADLEGINDLQALEQELELAHIEEGVLRQQVQSLEDSEELRLAGKLADSSWVTGRVAALRRGTVRWEHLYLVCEQRLRNLRAGQMP